MSALPGGSAETAHLESAPSTRHNGPVVVSPQGVSATGQHASGPALRLVGAEGGTGGEGGGGGVPLPQTGLVLVGTIESIPMLAAQVSLLSPTPVITGCLVVGNQPDGVYAECPVLGRLEDLPSIQARRKLRAALVCVPRVSADHTRRLTAMFESLGITPHVVPTLDELLTTARPGPGTTESSPPPSVPGAPTARRYRPQPPLDMAALIGRTPYGIDHESVARILTGKRVLITGAGGSIGSELARVAAKFDPSLLILMERAENALFEIDRQMAERHPSVRRRAVLHDVVDEGQTRRLLEELRPHVVFHAAAHKHVPLMEDHPGHAVTNNLFGTKAIADAASAVGAERFVMISSDKAVNPRSVMGATKRLAEIYVRSLAAAGCPADDARDRNGEEGGTRFSMVRFGNVLGSACSVLTIWNSQLAEGGPLTVTDPRMTRYFMTIPEAATLVIQSAAIRHDTRLAPVYVLDMGEPVRIVDLAKRFAAAHGLAANVRLPEGAPAEATHEPADLDAESIDVVFTGARPGEKLHEELAYAAESLRSSRFPGINTWVGDAPDAGDALRGVRMVADLSAVRQSTDRAAILAAIRRHVPEMNGV